MKLLRLAASVASMCAMSVALAVTSAAPASAAYAPTPVGPTGWVPDGPVLAVVTSGSSVFVGGTFTGGFAALDATTGALLWTGHADGGVRALAMSADGTHLIAGGGFLTVDGAAHRKLASINAATGVAESQWRGSAGGMVRDIQVVGDTAYFGGTFSKHNGIVQRGLGAVSVTTGKAVTSFTAATDGDVYALATDGTRLAVGGKFTNLNGQARNGLGSVTLAGGSLDAWKPAPPCSTCLKYWDLALDSGMVYGVGRNSGAAVALDFTTGALRWRAAANGDAQAVAVAGGKVYVGGHFTLIGTPQPQVPRFILAALDQATGALDPDFTPSFVTSYPGIWALAATPTRLYAGGYFTAAGPTPPKRYPYFAMYGS
jgi:outer membrane protein assembly factor BamB